MSAVPTLTAENVRELPLEAKRQLLVLVARDLMAGSGVVSVTDATGEIVVYAVPANDPARKAELAARLDRLHTAIPLSEVIADLKQQAARLQNPQS